MGPQRVCVHPAHDNSTLTTRTDGLLLEELEPEASLRHEYSANTHTQRFKRYYQGLLLYYYFQG